MATRKKFISILAVCAASIAGLSSGSVTAEAPQTFENDYRNSLWDGSGDSFSAKPTPAPGIEEVGEGDAVALDPILEAALTLSEARKTLSAKKFSELQQSTDETAVRLEQSLYDLSQSVSGGRAGPRASH